MAAIGGFTEAQLTTTTIVPELSYSSTNTLKAFMTFNVVTGIGGNFMVLFAICFLPAMRNPVNTYLANLALTDMLLSMVVNPVVIVHYDHIPNNDAPEHVECRAMGFLTVWFVATGWATLALVAANLYVRVCHRKTYRRLYSKRNVFTSVCVVWLLILLLLLLPFTFGGDYGWNALVGACLWKNDHKSTAFAFIAVECFILMPMFSFTLFAFFSVFRQFKTIHERANLFRTFEEESLKGSIGPFGFDEAQAEEKHKNDADHDINGAGNAKNDADNAKNDARNEKNGEDAGKSLSSSFGSSFSDLSTTTTTTSMPDGLPRLEAARQITTFSSLADNEQNAIDEKESFPQIETATGSVAVADLNVAATEVKTKREIQNEVTVAAAVDVSSNTPESMVNSSSVFSTGNALTLGSLQLEPKKESKQIHSKADNKASVSPPAQQNVTGAPDNIVAVGQIKGATTSTAPIANNSSAISKGDKPLPNKNRPNKNNSNENTRIDQSFSASINEKKPFSGRNNNNSKTAPLPDEDDPVSPYGPNDATDIAVGRNLAQTMHGGLHASHKNTTTRRWSVANNEVTGNVEGRLHAQYQNVWTADGGPSLAAAVVTDYESEGQSCESLEMTIIGMDDEEVKGIVAIPHYVPEGQKENCLANIEERELSETEHFTKSLFLLWLCFVTFWLPCILGYNLITTTYLPKWILYYFFAFATTSSSIQFLTHAVTSPKFREAYKIILTLGFRGDLTNQIF